MNRDVGAAASHLISVLLLFLSMGVEAGDGPILMINSMSRFVPMFFLADRQKTGKI
jgi:hypothetical protein